MAKSFPNLVFCLCFKIPPCTRKNVAVSLYVTENLYKDPLRAKADSIYIYICAFHKCMCVLRICLQMHADKLT